MTTNETLNRFADGSSFEGYTIVRLLATGGMGEVYEATHTFTGRAVALKVLKLGRAASAEAIRRAKLEAVVLSKLNHPNVVKVHDANIVDEAIVWIAMERLQGCTLRELIHRRGA
jgi:serine/threonine-protein kinase